LSVFRGHGHLVTGWALRRAAGRATGRSRTRGQSLVEFALILPILLLLTLIAVDFGRVYLGWINLQNMTRIAANYASDHAENLANNGAPGHATAVTQYTNQIANDARATNCPLAPGQPALPDFTDVDGNGTRTDIGDRVTVNLTCRFQVVTPIISIVIGSTINVSATSVFPVKSANVQTSSGGGGGGGCLPPTAGINATPGTTGSAPLNVTFRDASGGGSPTGWHWEYTVPTGAPAINDSTAQDPGLVTFTVPGTYSVKLTASNACGSTFTNPPLTITVTPTTPPTGCVVPDFNNVKFTDAQGIWGTPKPPGAGFTTTVLAGPGHPNNNGWRIQSQSIVANTTVPCNSSITVNNP
jgi:PKD repeat protein